MNTFRLSDNLLKKQSIKEMEFCPLEIQKYMTRKLLKNQSRAMILLKKHSAKKWDTAG